MNLKRAAAVLLIIAALGLSACSESVENTARDSANNVTNAAKDTARKAAQDELCRYVEDKKVSAQEAAAIRGAAQVAEAAGVEKKLVDAARAVANTTDGKDAPQGEVDKMIQECQQAKQ